MKRGLHPRWGVRLLAGLAMAGCLAFAVAVGGAWAYAGSYGVHALFRHGGTWWVDVGTGSAWLSPAMRLAAGPAPVATPGDMAWRRVADGFEVADLSAIVDGDAVDHVLLARIDPARFRFAVRSAPDGDMGLDQWMVQPGVALVVNGSYFAIGGKPAMPMLSDGVPLGPSEYDAKAGAFVASPGGAAIRDLAQTDWPTAFRGAMDAMVSYPMLLADGAVRVARPSRWLATRSFVGEDAEGWIVVGTTTDGFFTLDRFARFLQAAPLRLTRALNLDGGPVASQGIAVNGFERRSYGRWEAQVEGDRASLLVWPYGTVPMPVVLLALPR